MSLEQSTAAAISEIDRTLRSLGIHDVPVETRQLAHFGSGSSDSTLVAQSRQAASVQTLVCARVSAGTQSSTSTCSTSVQHSPSQRTFASQTDATVEHRDQLKHFACMASEISVATEQVLISIEHTALHCIQLHIDKLCGIENKLIHVSQSAQSLKDRCLCKSLENEELTNRMLLMNSESTTRHDLVFSHFTQRSHLDKAALEYTRINSDSSLRRGVENSCQPAVRRIYKQSSDSSLNDLTELLDECWKVLDA